ncbi:MAG: DUF4276 family protein [Candidatus Eremiobacteraeota bacterium]|nr:DUF4276 family protein [Candidatus Eremiobacteraeota bacterium]
MNISRIMIYVEGPSDKLVLESILRPVVDEAEENYTLITFHERGGKDDLVTKTMIKSANILMNDLNAFIFIVPDLYPLNKGIVHNNYQELKTELINNFERKIIQSRFRNEIENIRKRFFVHCFKYELETLILASPNNLKRYLRTDNLEITWKHPPEDQNDINPPSKIIERIFRVRNKKYKKTKDGPAILRNVDYRELASICNQNFKPFVEDIIGIIRKRQA